MSWFMLYEERIKDNKSNCKSYHAERSEATIIHIHRSFALLRTELASSTKPMTVKTLLTLTN